jgi:hypothetical protein
MRRFFVVPQKEWRTPQDDVPSKSFSTFRSKSSIHACRAAAGQAARILDLRDNCEDRRNRNPGAANANHAQPFGYVPAVARIKASDDHF